MKAQKPARGTAALKKPQPRGDRKTARGADQSARGRKRLGDPPPRRRNPTREGRPQQSVPPAGPIRRRRTDRPVQPKSVSQAKARSKARKAKAPKIVRTPLKQRILLRLTAIEFNPRSMIARVPFVVLIIAALGTGLGVTLWLSTDAAERSYQLGNARQLNQALMQQKEALERDVLEAQAAPALAEAARELGMIPSRDTAHLVQDAAGNWVVVGTPKPAEGAPPPPLNAPLAEPAPPVPAAPRVVEPLEVPVRIPPVSGDIGAPDLMPGMLTAPGMPGVPGISAAPGMLAPPGVPGGGLVLNPGLEVPHSVAGPQTPGPGPLPFPDAGAVGAAAPEVPPQLLPEAASPPTALMGVDQQLGPLPGEPA